MKKIKILLVTLVCFCISISSVSQVAAQETLETLVAEAIYYYKEGSETDVLRTLDAIKENYPDDYDTYKSVMDYWYYLDTDWIEYLDVAPDGLPNDSTHAFVVLGFELNDDGTMKDELIGRLTVALACANKYPNSYIVLTGGAEKNSVREADAMREWLLAEGLSDSRIIVENNSNTTVENAQNTFNQLYNSYDIKTISMVTSQYHLKRGTLLYYAQSLLSAAQYNKTPIEIIGNAGWLREDKTSEGISLLSNSLAQILDVSSEFRSISDLAFSVLESISVTNPNKVSYTLGEELDLTGMVATATYDTGYSRDVTDYITVTGYDSATLGTQTITVEYTETDLNTGTDVTVSVNFDVVVNTASTSITSGGSSTTESASSAKTGDSDIAWTAVVLFVAFSAGLFIYKKRKISS